MDITATDAYKFSMAEAGAALRPETFYYSHRKGGYKGWHLMPVDVHQYIKNLIPQIVKSDYEYLNKHNYDLGAATRKAYSLFDTLKINAVPQGSWFYNREPAFTITGPSACVSWLEPLVLMLQFRIQAATNDYILNKMGRKLNEKNRFVTCEEEKNILEETYQTFLKFPLSQKLPKIKINKTYSDEVFERASKLVDAVKNPDRIFEVGMRAVSCLQQHSIALQAIKEAGILRTSNAYLAKTLGMIPVGTMGHEHCQRFGNDYQAYIAMRDRFPGFLFYLPDTFNPMRSGIPNALRVIAETPNKIAGIRFDSEHGIESQYVYTIEKAREMGIGPILALESGWNLELTKRFEALREVFEWPEDQQCYGYGSYLVKPNHETFCRDDVSAVYKLCKTGSNGVMKFGNELGEGKQSIPGKPIVLRPKPAYYRGGPIGYILQEGEDWTPDDGATEYMSTFSPDYAYFNSPFECYDEKYGLIYSPETQKLINKCKENRNKIISET